MFLKISCLQSITGGDILISKRLIALLFNGLDGENAEFFDDVN